MKPISTLIFALCTTATITTANAAATKCIKTPISTYGAETTCTGSVPNTNYDSDWSISCTDYNNITTQFKGIGFCSAFGSSYSPATSIGYSVAAARYCWCKMTSPAVSKWIYMYDYSTEDTCKKNCASKCGVSDAIIHARQFLSNLDN